MTKKLRLLYNSWTKNAICSINTIYINTCALHRFPIMIRQMQQVLVCAKTSEVTTSCYWINLHIVSKVFAYRFNFKSKTTEMTWNTSKTCPKNHFFSISFIEYNFHLLSINKVLKRVYISFMCSTIINAWCVFNTELVESLGDY